LVKIATNVMDDDVGRHLGMLSRASTYGFESWIKAIHMHIMEHRLIVSTSRAQKFEKQN
jgi:hypothetical protein